VLYQRPDIVEPELLLLHAKHEASSVMGRSLSYSSGSSSSSSGMDATSQRNRLLLEATQANLDVYRDERVKYSHGSDQVRARHHVSKLRFRSCMGLVELTGGCGGSRCWASWW
jgi:hypothetical protein